ncbi:protein NRT1/ PTR FAMILY 3.1-like [Nymphaea colorata]|nr:protein NRT1/ PTR FAMILY 3.1-like [Nymphaea colorata]
MLPCFPSKVRSSSPESPPANTMESKEKRRGGLRTMPFILATDVCDRFAATGFSSNMITYLTQVLHMPMVQASNTLTNFAGTAALTPLIGGLIADSFAGRFWTIAVASVIYQLGMLCLTLSAILRGTRPPPCSGQQPCQEASTGQLWILYFSLLLTSIGSGGLRPCVVAFGADQLDLSKSKKTKDKTSNFFNWYYFCMGVASLLALTLVVYIQDNVGWGWGLGVPTIVMTISVVVFLLGYPLYVFYRPSGSPLTRLTQVVVAAIRKRSAIRPNDGNELYQNREMDASISITGRLLHSDQYKCLDRAAIITERDFTEGGNPKPWRLSTVHRVEELKSIIRTLPVWAATILLVTASSHQNTFSIQQARTMDRHLVGSFKIPPATMNVFTILSLLITLALYDHVIVPLREKYASKPVKWSYFRRMGIGMGVSILSTFVAGFVEVKRKNAAAQAGLLSQPRTTIPISVFWLIPQYSLHGISEAFTHVGHLQFLYDQSPESMRSFGIALFWIAISLGNYLSTLVVSLVHKYTGKEHNWLPNHNLNKGRLEYYYWFITGLQIVNLGYYIICTLFYTYKPLEVAPLENQANGVDGNGHVELAASGVNEREIRDPEVGAARSV